MERMGEPFLFGIGSATQFLFPHGLSVVSDNDLTRYLPNLGGDPIFPLYRFIVAGKV